MGTDGACGLLFCAAKRSGTFPPNIPAGLRARVSRLGGFTRPLSGLLFLKVVTHEPLIFFVLNVAKVDGSDFHDKPMTKKMLGL
jgi:hypothetical protein